MRRFFAGKSIIRSRNCEMQNKKERLKPLSLYGLDLKQALHAMLSVDPRKLNLDLEGEKIEEQTRPESRENKKEEESSQAK